MRAANVRIIYEISKNLISNKFNYICIMVLMSFLHFSFTDLLDILMVTALIYLIFRWIKGSSAMNIFIAIVMVLLIRFISDVLDMKMMSSVLGTIIDVGVIALIIIFQPEIRRFLNNLGRAGNKLRENSLLGRLIPSRKADTVSAKNSVEIAEACREMSEQKTGALIVLRKTDSLESITLTGDSIDAEIGRRLIMNIFFKNSPLHDGAMVIGGDRILAARCTLPITDRANLPASYGMRHKAAIGISEQCDADVIVVSEETGRISFVRNGVVTRVKEITKLMLLLGGTQNDGQQT